MLEIRYGYGVKLTGTTENSCIGFHGDIQGYQGISFGFVGIKRVSMDGLHG